MYGLGEAILITATFDAPVTVTGDPHLVFSVEGNRNAVYDATRSAEADDDKVVFAYTVRSSDRDDNGIWLYQSDDRAVHRARQRRRPSSRRAGRTRT